MSRNPKSGTIVTTVELAKLLGVTSRTVRGLAERGDVDRVAAGKYDLETSVKAYTASLRKAAAGRSSPAAEEKHRLHRLQADAVARKNAEACGELVKVADVRNEWAGLARDMRAAVPILIDRIRKTLPSLDEAAIAMLRTELEASVVVMDPDNPPGLKRKAARG